MLDWNCPPGTKTGRFPVVNISRYVLLKPLTTPEAYITTLPIEDPFGTRIPGDPKSSELGWGNFFWHSSYSTAREIHGYFFRSHGPDKFAGSMLMAILNREKTWEEAEAAGSQSPWYDGSNGTVSVGDIIRTRVIFDGLPAGIIEK